MSTNGNGYSPIGKEYQNPPNAGILRLFVGLSLFAVFMGIVVFAITSSFLILIVAFVGGSLYYLMFWWREIVHKPLRIRIENDGLVLHYRNRRTEYAKWDTIMMVNIGSDEPTGILGIFAESTMRLKDRLAWIPVTYELANAIRNGYYRSKGTYPPDWYATRQARHR